MDGLIAEMRGNHDAATRQLIIEALCRLYYREADYDGSWWGTRPDTSGPYFKPVTWEQSDEIAGELRHEAIQGDESTLRSLLFELQRHKLEFPDLAPVFIRAATDKTTLRPMVVSAVTQHGPYSRETISFLDKAILDSKEDPALRTAAFHGLQKSIEQVEVMEELFAIASEDGEQPVLKPLRAEFISDGRTAKNVQIIDGMRSCGSDSDQELAYAVMLNIAANANSPKPAVQFAQQTIDSAWELPRLPLLLRAIEETHATNYAEQVRTFVNNTNKEVALLATEISRQFEAAAPAPSGPVISRMHYEEAARIASSLPGDPHRGAALFDKLGCVKCHTIAKNEPLKGPFLGDITTRYKPSEIIESILRPSAKIAQGFTTVTVELQDGTEYDGFVVRESGDTLEMRNLAGPIVIQKKQIAKRGTRKTSIMPEGLFDLSTPSDLASMLAYLKSLAPK